MRKYTPRGAPLEDRLAFYTQEGEDCWIWTGGKMHAYGVLRVNGRGEFAHRVSYRVHHGPIPDGMLVCHTCDNPLCVRPDHLFLGTHADNQQDKISKGRQANGERTRRNKITAEQVLAIREDTRTSFVIADEYGISYWQVRDIKARRAWAHL